MVGQLVRMAAARASDDNIRTSLEKGLEALPDSKSQSGGDSGNAFQNAIAVWRSRAQQCCT